MIEETMLHGLVASHGCRPGPQRHRGRGVLRPAAVRRVVDAPVQVSQAERQPRGIRIDWDTVIIPRAVAEGVCEEVTVWLQTPLPRRWVHELIAHANTVYAHNERFRRRINGSGNKGRDYLWMFMRHWLAALLKDRRHHLFVRLPKSYSVGHELPPQRPFAAN